MSIINTGCNITPKINQIENHQEKHYIIKLRIVIDIDNTGQLASNRETINNYVNTFNNIVCETNIRAEIMKIEFMRIKFPSQNITVSEADDILSGESSTYPDYLTVYFLTPIKISINENPSVSIAGLGTLPMYGYHYVFVIPYYSDDYVFAHELGHSFGLYHTFDYEDYCDDTPYQDHPDLTNTNIMDYSGQLIRTITPNQIERIKHFMENDRKNISIVY